MVIHDKAKRVHESYLRAGGRDFVSSFYDKLMETSEEIREKFEHINMEEQTDILAHSIVMSFLFVDKNHQTAANTLNKVRESHNRDHLNITPELYDLWLDCMVETVSTCDPHANKQLLSDWHEVMSVAVNHIREGY